MPSTNTAVTLRATDNDDLLAFVFVMETVAANLGGMITPFGSPQNLYLYQYYALGIGDFLRIMALPFAVSTLLIVLTCLFVRRTPHEPVTFPLHVHTAKDAHAEQHEGKVVLMNEAVHTVQREVADPQPVQPDLPYDCDAIGCLCAPRHAAAVIYACPLRRVRPHRNHGRTGIQQEAHRRIVDAALRVIVPAAVRDEAAAIIVGEPAIGETQVADALMSFGLDIHARARSAGDLASSGAGEARLGDFVVVPAGDAHSLAPVGIARQVDQPAPDSRGRHIDPVEVDTVFGVVMGMDVAQRLRAQVVAQGHSIAADLPAGVAIFAAEDVGFEISVQLDIGNFYRAAAFHGRDHRLIRP